MKKMIVSDGGMNMTTQNIDLSRYVSNLDKKVYTIFNLPEEVIAVIFAYVSRSPASFRDNLKKLLADGELAMDETAGGMTGFYSEKAARFHEKWVVGYGHSSVAEHAVAHVGIEKISRLASAELELANSFNSFTEYSQRYQRPRRGDYFVPAELEQDPEAKQAFIHLNETAFDIYERLLSGLIDHLGRNLPRQEGESDKSFSVRVEKTAFEDARYVLTLATLTNLGMTGNGRALRDTIVRLLSSRHSECRRLAEEMEREISRVIPTLLKHVQPNDYLLQTRDDLAVLLPESPDRTEDAGRKKPFARFVQMPDYDNALTQTVAHLMVSERSTTYAQALAAADRLSVEEKERIVDTALRHLRFFDNPRDEFQHVTYTMELLISEANWHQLLRHNRRTHFSFGEPTVKFGYTIPPHVEEAGLTPIYEEAVFLATETYERIAARFPESAAYCVSNAHHRPVTATASLWELYHLINLRTSPEAQWDIRLTFEALHRELREKHPVFARYAQRRFG